MQTSKVLSEQSIVQLFFELLRASICLSELSAIPSPQEWSLLYGLAQKQSLVGICFNGLQQLYENNPEQTANLPLPLKMQWVGMAAKIQQRNEYMNERCVELQAKLLAAGFRNSILKGQGMATLYAKAHLDFLRQPGDIDVYVDASREEVIRYAQTLGDANPDWDYKHLHLKIYKDVEVEVHYVPEVFLNPWKNQKLQRWFMAHEEDIFDAVIIRRHGISTKTSLVSPSIDFNVFYVLLHIYRHFLYEGIGLRQLLDYYFVLKSYSDTSRSSLLDIQETIKCFGMERFAKGIMWVLQHVFGLDAKYLICKTDKKEGEYILSQIMQGGNFGHYDERLKTSKSGKLGAVSKILKHNIHLLSHYPLQTICVPIWIIFHFLFKCIITNRVNSTKQ